MSSSSSSSSSVGRTSASNPTTQQACSGKDAGGNDEGDEFSEAVAIILALYREHGRDQSQLPSKRKVKRVLQDQLPHFRVNGSTLGRLVAKATDVLEAERCIKREAKLDEKRRLIECRRRVESQFATHGDSIASDGGSAACPRPSSTPAAAAAAASLQQRCDVMSGQVAAATSKNAAAAGSCPKITSTTTTQSIAFLHFAPEKYPEILQRRSSTLISRFRSLRVRLHRSPNSAKAEESAGQSVMDESTEVQVFASEPTHYRMRVGLGVFDDNEVQYHRHLPPSLPPHEVAAGAVVDGLRYVYWLSPHEANPSGEDPPRDAGAVPINSSAPRSGEPRVRKKNEGRARKMVNVGHSFPIASGLICKLMPLLLQGIGRVFAKTLRVGLRCVRFLSTLSGDCVIALVYRQRGLEAPWATDAALLMEWLNRALKQNAKLQMHATAPSTNLPGAVVGVVGHSKGVKNVVGQDYVVERGLHRPDASKTRLLYRQAEASFSNPNASVCQATINWLYATMEKVKLFVTTRLEGLKRHPFSLMELYCGNANHSVALSPVFDRIFGVEINPRLVEAARNNLRMNEIDNVLVLEADCHAFSKCMDEPYSRSGGGGGGGGECETLAVECNVGRALRPKQPSPKRCRRGVLLTTGVAPERQEDHPLLKQSGKASPSATVVQRGHASQKQPESIAATVVLVDPPRAGLDPQTRAFVQRFPFVVYISCNPESLLRDFAELGQSHRVASFCFLDHFPYTEHTECAVLLARRGLDFQPSTMTTTSVLDPSLGHGNKQVDSATCCS